MIGDLLLIFTAVFAAGACVIWLAGHVLLASLRQPRRSASSNATTAPGGRPRHRNNFTLTT